MNIAQKKKVSLKDGKIAYLLLYGISGGDFTVICAKNKNGSRVAECIFSYMYVFERPLSSKDREIISKKNNVPLESVPYVKEFKLDEFHTQKYKISGNEIVFSNGDRFKVKRKYLNLIGIKILNREFYKVGLGTAMIKEVEKLALKNGCDSIEGMYFPNGEFHFGTNEFYKRNGFEFYRELGVRCIRKKLTSPLLQNGVN